MLTKIDVVIVGAGIIGLTTAWNILEKRPKTKLVIIEKEKSVALHQSGRSSGVLHTGIYYKPGSIKAITCRLGYKKMIDFCQTHSVPFDICGKLIVATTIEELPILDVLYQQGVSNGLKGLRFLNSFEIKEFEPFCEGIRAILVPETGIIQYKAVSDKIAFLLIKKGVEIIFDEEVLSVTTKIDTAKIVTSSRELIAKTAIICAGLYSDRLALKSELNLPLRILPFRGEYFKFKPQAPRLIRNLIYPVPNPKLPFLGVHFTRMIDGTFECGPNAVLALGREAYNKTDFNFHDILEVLSWPGFHKLTSSYWKAGLSEYWRSLNKNVFVKDLQKLVPEVKSSYLEPATAGIRAQACNRDGNLVYDFDIRTKRNLIHICNAPSPAATSSLAIGEIIANKALPFLD